MVNINNKGKQSKSTRKDLEISFEHSHRLAGEIDIKLPEIFIISTSIIIVFLSTFEERNFWFFISICIFLITIIFSLASLILFKLLNKTLGSTLWDHLFPNQDESSKRELPMRKVKILRRSINVLHYLTFLLFILGLISIILIN